MASGTESTTQLGVKVTTSVFKRLKAYCDKDFLAPAMWKIVNQAITEYLDRKDGK